MEEGRGGWRWARPSPHFLLYCTSCVSVSRLAVGSGAEDLDVNHSLSPLTLPRPISFLLASHSPLARSAPRVSGPGSGPGDAHWLLLLLLMLMEMVMG